MVEDHTFIEAIIIILFPMQAHYNWYLQMYKVAQAQHCHDSCGHYTPSLYQCNTNIKFQTEYEYMHNLDFDQIRIPNMHRIYIRQVKLTKY